MKTFLRALMLVSLVVFSSIVSAHADETSMWDEFEFSAGEVAAFAADTSALQVKFFLDETGRPSDSLKIVHLDDRTVLTDGEKTLDKTALVAGKPIDVEYEKSTGRVTYIFVY